MVFSFPPDHSGQAECFVPQLYQCRRGISGGPALKYFYMIHRGGRKVETSHLFWHPHNTLVYTHPLPHSHPPHGMSANFVKWCSRNIPLKATRRNHAFLECWVWIPNLGALPIIAPVSFCLFACSYDSVSNVHTFFSTCLSSCVASAAWCVFGFVLITTFLISLFFTCKFNTYFGHGALVIRMSLLICLSLFSICVFILPIPAYVHKHSPGLLFDICTHSSPFSYVLFVLCPILMCMFFVWLLLCAKLK